MRKDTNCGPLSSSGKALVGSRPDMAFMASHLTYFGASVSLAGRSNSRQVRDRRIHVLETELAWALKGEPLPTPMLLPGQSPDAAADYKELQAIQDSLVYEIEEENQGDPYQDATEQVRADAPPPLGGRFRRRL